MRLVIQRVKRATVTINGKVKSSIGQGLLVLVGIAHDDTGEDLEWLAKKTIALRIFDDEQGIMNRSVTDIGGEIIVVSQFTLMGDCRKGNRPSWINAAPHTVAIPLYEAFCKRLSTLLGKPVGTGEFGADMQVELVNDGPVTMVMEHPHPEKAPTEILSLVSAQQLVDKWVKTYGVRYFSELTNMACLTEEVGELARIMARTYGDQSFKKGENHDLGDEMADVLWVLLCLANQTGVDLTEAFRKNMDKKTARDQTRHLNNNKLK